MQYRICVLTGTRAEYGLLRRLLLKMKDDPEIELHLAVTGSHLSPHFGNTQNEISQDGFIFDRLPIPMEGDSNAAMARSAGAATIAFAAYLDQLCPDIAVLLGDRYEAFAFAAAAYMLLIPIAHISGGDVTEGALDDGFRHCITKFSALHFPGCMESARRVIQMGEAPERVFTVGDPGVENCLNTPLWSRERLQQDLRFPWGGKSYGVVTFHPVTQEQGSAATQLRELIRALEEQPDMGFLITLANADAGGGIINEIWKQEAGRHENWLLRSSLGMVRYLSAVKYAKVVIGNSSSGIVEAPVLATPTVDIGDRQKGRMRAESVIHCEPEWKAVSDAIRQAISESFQTLARCVVSPFESGNTSGEILRVIKEALSRGLCAKKTFYDLPIS